MDPVCNVVERVLRSVFSSSVAVVLSGGDDAAVAERCRLDRVDISQSLPGLPAKSTVLCPFLHQVRADVSRPLRLQAAVVRAVIGMMSRAPEGRKQNAGEKNHTGGLP